MRVQCFCPGSVPFLTTFVNELCFRIPNLFWLYYRAANSRDGLVDLADYCHCYSLSCQYVKPRYFPMNSWVKTVLVVGLIVGRTRTQKHQILDETNPFDDEDELKGKYTWERRIDINSSSQQRWSNIIQRAACQLKRTIGIENHVKTFAKKLSWCLTTAMFKLKNQFSQVAWQTQIFGMRQKVSKLKNHNRCCCQLVIYKLLTIAIRTKIQSASLLGNRHLRATPPSFPKPHNTEY